MHDRKVAELHHSVWMDAVVRYHLEEKVEDWCDSFIQIGEVAVKIFWDPSAGKWLVLNLYTTKMGNNLSTKTAPKCRMRQSPVPAGQFVFEEVYGFNLLRPPECKET